jgi:quinol monooxygenase YgiN
MQGASVPVLVATITPKAGQLEAVEAVLKSLIPAIHEEDGCELYALNRGKERLVFVEKWRDMAALGAHGSGENIKMLNEKLKGLVAGAPDVQVLDAVPAGDAAKGAV